MDKILDDANQRAQALFRIAVVCSDFEIYDCEWDNKTIQNMKLRPDF